jgi:hypothetical protein
MKDPIMMTAADMALPAKRGPSGWFCGAFCASPAPWLCA